jgi:CRISPR-associated protein Cas6
MQIDLVFALTGETIPIDHAYRLYGALSSLIPAIHAGELPARFAPIVGLREKARLLRLTKHSVLRLRLPSDQIHHVLCLSGHSLRIGEANVRVAAPRIMSLEPAPIVRARMVTFKHSLEADYFLETARKQLAKRGIAGEPILPVFAADHPRAGQSLRKVLRIKDRAIVGYSLVVQGLSAEESLRLQEEGLGGRSRLSCGFFLPDKPRLG